MIELKKALHIIYTVLQFTFLLTAIGIILLYLFGIRIYVVTTGSMSPAIPEGSMCIVNHNIPFSEIREGDVITFSAGETMRVTHRAIRIEEDGIVTKGDANNTEDPKVTPERYIGKTILSIPHIGSVITFLKSCAGIITVIILLLLLMIPTFFRPKTDLTEQHRSPE